MAKRKAKYLEEDDNGAYRPKTDPYVKEPIICPNCGETVYLTKGDELNCPNCGTTVYG